MDGSKPKEGTPLSINKIVRSHGAVSLRNKCSSNDASVNSSVEHIQTKSLEDNATENAPMSLTRKAFFLLSFNLWILYFAAFLWLIPCRKIACSVDKIWTTTLHDIDITTNLEPIHNSIEKGLFAFGYTSESDLSPYLAVFDSESGTPLWNGSLPFVANRLQCHMYDNSDRCTVIGDSDAASYFSFNGTLQWYTPEISTALETLSSDVLQVVCSRNNSLMLYTKKDNVDDVLLCSLDKDTGQFYTSFRLPCDQLPSRMEYYQEINELLFLCWQGPKMNAWLLPSKTICSAGDSEAFSFDLTMNKLHKMHSRHSTFDIKITREKDTLMVTSNELHMVSRSGRTLWKKTFTDSVIAQSITGKFVLADNECVMVALDDMKGNTEVKVFNLKDGKEMLSTIIGERKPISLSLISRKTKGPSIDLALLKTEDSFNETSTRDNSVLQSSTDHDKSSSITYFVVGRDGSHVISSRLLTSSVRKNAVISINSGGEDSQLVLEESAGGTVTFTGYLLKKQNGACTP